MASVWRKALALPSLARFSAVWAELDGPAPGRFGAQKCSWAWKWGVCCHSSRAATQEPKAKSQSRVFPAASAVWQDRAELQAGSVLHKSFRVICVLMGSACPWGERLRWEDSPVDLFVPASPRWGSSKECVYAQLGFCSPFHVPYLPGGSEFPGGRQAVAVIAVRAEAERSRLLAAGSPLCHCSNPAGRDAREQGKMSKAVSAQVSFPSSSSWLCTLPGML